MESPEQDKKPDLGLLRKPALIRKNLFKMSFTQARAENRTCGTGHGSTCFGRAAGMVFAFHPEWLFAHLITVWIKDYPGLPL